MAARKGRWNSKDKSYIADRRGLRKIPDELLKPPICHHVRVIDLNWNKIKDLPPNIGTLWTELRELWLGFNELRYIPESVCDLKKLEVLDVRFNKLERLTPSLTRLTNLKSFYCSQIEGVLLGHVWIVNNPSEFRKLWDRLFTQKTVIRAYIAMCGPYSAGKSSTKNHMVGVPFKIKCRSTKGGDVLSLNLDDWTIIHKARSKKSRGDFYKSPDTTRSTSRTIKIHVENKESLQASSDGPSAEKLRRVEERIRQVEDTESIDCDATILDFAGQHVYEISHQIFMAEKGLYILVVDLSKTLDDIYEHDMGSDNREEITVKEYICGWMNSIHSHTADGDKVVENIIVVGTKTDLITEELVKSRVNELAKFLRTELMDPAKHIAWPIIYLSNKPSPDGKPSDGMKCLKAKIRDIVSKMMYKVSFEWLLFELRLNQSLIYQNSSIMEMTDVYTIGEEISLCKEEVDKAIAFFHSTRDIIHFKGDSKVSSKVIVSPQWFIDLLRLVINHTFPLAEKHDLSQENHILYDKLCTHGKLDVEWVRWVLNKEDRAGDEDILIKLFQLYDIIYPCPPESGSEVTEYYMACLMNRKAEPALLSPLNSTSSPTLCYHFDRRYLPNSLYHQLVIRCTKKWQYAKLFHKHTRFFIGNKHVLIMSMTKSDITLTVKTDPAGSKAVKLKSSYGPEVREYVENNLNDLIKRYNPGLSYTPCLKCSCGKHALKITPDGKDMDDGCVDRSKDGCIHTHEIYAYDWYYWDSSSKDHPVIIKLDVKSDKTLSVEWNLGKETKGFLEISEDKREWKYVDVNDTTGSYTFERLHSQTTYYCRVKVECDMLDIGSYTVSADTKVDGKQSTAERKTKSSIPEKKRKASTAERKRKASKAERKRKASTGERKRKASTAERKRKASTAERKTKASVSERQMKASTAERKRKASTTKRERKANTSERKRKSSTAEKNKKASTAKSKRKASTSESKRKPSRAKRKRRVSTAERKRKASTAEEISTKRSRGNGAITSSKDITVTNERFNDMLVTFHKKIGKDELTLLQQYCRDVHIQKGTLETKKNAYEIFVCLKELGKITLVNTKLLEELLVKIGRTDLVTNVKKYHYTRRL
uniref:Uncharacterized protein LOC100367918 n=1 Tax=Saccoglossus kowalevskii TaxID=10224 RepID=A0ABM0GND7_SACKO|nr:PREDICTED: uncharacterized protein LOC100367918 [Saccoglossus kowalevskii]